MSDEHNAGSPRSTKEARSTIKSAVCDINTNARNNPVMLLGAVAFLGFVVSRCAKTSGDYPTRSMAQKNAQQKAQVADFVNEGNPNTQPVVARK